MIVSCSVQIWESNGEPIKPGDRQTLTIGTREDRQDRVILYTSKGSVEVDLDELKRALAACEQAVLF